MWYFILSIILAVWIIIDSRGRRANVLGWAAGTVLLPVIFMPIYFAIRPLKAGETREGGKGWNLLRNFSLLWTLFMAVAAIVALVKTGQHTVTLGSDAERAGAAIGTTLGMGMLGAIWFFPVLGALVLGLFIKKSSMVEQGPTDRLVAGKEVKTEEPASATSEKRKKTILPVVGIIAAILGLSYVGSKILSQKSSSPAEVQTVPTVQRHGYLLQSRESAVLSWLLKDEMSAFQSGGPTQLFEGHLQPVSAVEVAKAYEDNQVAADQKYFQKRLKLTGVIEGINSGLSNEPYVALRGANMFLSPQAHFENPNVERVATLKKGQKLTLVCEGGGAIVGTPMFKNCLFLDDYATQKIVKIKQQIEGFLAGKQQEDSIERTTIVAISIGRVLPESSTCFSDANNCGAEIGAVITKDPALHRTAVTVIEELRTKGVQVSDTLAKKIESMAQKASGNSSE